MRRPIALFASLFLLAGLPPAAGQSSSITVASTTSTEQSGLFGYILPRFTSKTGIGVNVVALGTGQALDVGRRGDADVVFVHDQPAEEAFVAQGFGVKRYPVMYNDFVLIGPQADPAKIAADKDILDALRKIAAAKVPFISRGDRSPFTTTPSSVPRKKSRPIIRPSTSSGHCRNKSAPVTRSAMRTSRPFAVC